MKYDFDEIIERQGTNSIKYDLREKVFGQDDIIPMWVADMDFKTPRFIIEALKTRLEHEILGYTFRGREFYQSIVYWMKNRHNWNIKPEWISFSPGVVPAINISIQAFTNPGDKIIVQPPVYFPFFSAVKGNNRIMLENQLQYVNGKYYIDFDHLKSLIDNKVRLLILSNPHNPVGRVWSKEELEKLVQICSENNIIILSDEIHSDLIFPGHKHIPLASVSGQAADITISFFSPSKTFNLAGLSTSAVISSNEKLLARFNKFAETMHLNMGNIFGFVALQNAYNKGEEWLSQLLLYLSENMLFTKTFIRNKIPALQLVEPESTYLLWIDFGKLKQPNKEISRLLIDKAKVGLSDGRMFGKGGEGFFRMNIATPKPVIKEALIRIEKAVS